MHNKELRSHLWHSNGINIIHDIVNEKGFFLSSNKIESKFGIKCDALKYNTLKDAIPSTWRKILQSMKITQEAISFQEALNLKIRNRVVNIGNLTKKDLY